MGTPHASPEPPSDTPLAATPDCPLSRRQQTQNLVLYGVNVALVYLASPALYVGIVGAGELWGVYFPNYILCCSAKSRMRRNMSFTSMLYMLTAFASYAFGAIADRYGLRTSFVVSLIVLGSTLLFVEVLLPARPQPREADRDASDQAPALDTKIKAAALT